MDIIRPPLLQLLRLENLTKDDSDSIAVPQNNPGLLTLEKLSGREKGIIR